MAKKKYTAADFDALMSCIGDAGIEADGATKAIGDCKIEHIPDIRSRLTRILAAARNLNELAMSLILLEKMQETEAVLKQARRPEYLSELK